jgi:hypothetical protein
MDKGFLADGFPVFFRQGLIGVPGKGPDPARFIVPRHPAVAMNGVALLIRNHRIAWQQKLRQTPVVSVFPCVAARGDDQTIIGFLNREAGGFVQYMVFVPEVGTVPHALNIGIRHAKSLDRRMKRVGVAGVDAAFDRLKVVGFLEALGNVPMCFLHPCPFQFRQFRDRLGRTHVHPHQAAVLLSLVSGNPHLVLKPVFGGSFGISTQAPFTSNFQP